MSVWQLVDYCTEAGVNLFQEWFDGQEDDIQAEVEYALAAFCANAEWTEAPEVIPLDGQFMGLYAIRIEMQTADGRESEFRAVGSWIPDSRKFILFQMSEFADDKYEPPLEEALRLMESLEIHGKGTLNDHAHF